MKAIIKTIIILSIILFFSQVQAQKDTLFISEIMPFQKEIVSQLSGEKPIKDDIYLKQRASPGERQLTADFLSQQLTDMGWQLDNHHYKATNGNPILDLIISPSKGINVAAILPATTPNDEYIIFGGHYDSERESPGAIDNATGVALCLAIAQKLKKLKERNKNFIIVFFDQEEDDEVGSREYVKMLKNKKLDVHSVHIMDMMGWDSNNNKAVTFQSPTTFLDKIYVDIASKLHIPFEFVDGGSSDNRQFIAGGYNTIATFEEDGDSTPYIHKPTDTYTTVDFDYLASGTGLIYEVFKTLAQ